MSSEIDDRTNEVKFQELLEVAQASMQRLRVPGVAIGLLADGVEYTTGLGVTSIENPLPVTAQTLFQIGSTTKTITSTVIFRLLEQGKLELDDRVRKYIPSFCLQDEDAAAGATIRHLLNHTGGWLGDYEVNTGQGEDALARYVEKMIDAPQRTPLGALYTYNNTSFNLAGRIIELVTGKNYEETIHEMLLGPLEMSNSFFFMGQVMLSRFVVGHSEKDEKLFVSHPWEMPRADNPCGGLVSDAIDQLRYARFHMGDGTTPKGERLLSPESIKQMQTPTVSAGGDGWVGLNWFVNDIGGVRFISHGGSTNGQQSAFWFAPEKKLAFTVLTNHDKGTVLEGELTRWVYKHYLGVEEIDPAAIQMPVEQLAEYAAGYVLAPYGDTFEVKIVESRLLLTHIPGDHSSISATASDPYPPMHADVYAADRFVFIDEPFKGMKGEFLRNESGQITWLRVGGRVLARKP